MAEENNGVQGQAQGQQGAATDGNDVTFTEEQQAHVNAMIADRLSRADKANESKLQKALDDARAKWDKEQKEAADIANMSDKQRQKHEQEKANEALTQAQAEADKLRAELNHTNMVNEASKMLADKGFTADEETLNFVVRDTAEDTTQAVTAFAKLVYDKVEAKRQEALHGQTPNNASASQGQGKSFGAQMAEKSNSRSLSGVADDFFGTKAK
ncbi:DUF4355 domain-containing protein [Weissella paramesenteroides]|uniref:DUF4355 domain-containing protein n=1 Tax=Weissella paramesenteroides TaxID=1249 RepID=UPI00123901B1|nr:DUF4355 domain-containing protein [Weissella paramesenteroides]KAA8446545.1 DUF4355 domain-containing protein [Weissella paramesenteroides]KAA8454559.1 DUF4355 domain-containing protein [Weissella paramesenteroides]